jgi:threonylcarbamoyladenosine tRNA methylthiotransferase MtaB
MRVYLHTFGCKANQYDTEVVRQALTGAGASIVDDIAEADAAVVNSCTVTESAEAKMRHLVRSLGRRGVATVVTGCAAALDDGGIASIPGVRDVVGGANPRRVLDALRLPSDRVAPLLRRFDRGSRAWLRIQDGCDEHCTFCATTLARGANRSRAGDEVVREAMLLAEHHQEIVLTGVHIGTYGQDVDDGSSLGGLLERLVVEVPRVRFRLSSVEATEVDQRLAELMVGAPDRVAPHLHAPLQSGSDPVLKRMGRHWYTAATYAGRIAWLAQRLDLFGLGADVIVGFPGETDQDHAATVSLIEALPFTYLHVFPYSPRPGAAATRLGRPVGTAVARRRAAELRALGDAKREAYLKARATLERDLVLLDRTAGRFHALTEDYFTAYLSTGQSVPRRWRGRLVEREGALWVA